MAWVCLIISLIIFILSLIDIRIQPETSDDFWEITFNDTMGYPDINDRNQALCCGLPLGFMFILLAIIFKTHHSKKYRKRSMVESEIDTDTEVNQKGQI